MCFGREKGGDREIERYRLIEMKAEEKVDSQIESRRTQNAKRCVRERRWK